MKTDLTHVDIQTQAIKALFRADSVAPEIVKKAEPGLRVIEKFVSTVLAQEVLPHAVAFDDVVEIMGGNPRKVRHDIREAIKVGQEFYDGTYGRPDIDSPDHIVYVVTAMVIRETGRKNRDINTYISRVYMPKFINLRRIKSPYDLSCYAFLVDYFEHALYFGRKPITKSLKDHSGKYLTSRRIMNLLERQDWYGDFDKVKGKLGIGAYSPKLSEFTNAVFEILLKEKGEELRRAERYELDKAFDNSKK